MATNEQLERSIQLLDDIASEAPKSKVLKLNQSSAGIVPLLSRSMAFNDTYPANLSKIRHSDLDDLNMSFAPGELTYLIDDSVTFKVPKGLPSKSSLTKDFKDCFRNIGTTYLVLDAISNFLEIISSAIKVKLANKSNLSSSQGDSELLGLIYERNTWSLMYALYKDRMTNQNNEFEFPTSFNSEKEIVDYLYKTDGSVRECQIIVDWLEHLAFDQWNMEGGAQIGHFTDKTVSWENTLHQLQNDTVSFRSSRPIVTSLDPDAPRREKKSLHDLDYDDEQRLLREVFREIRMGRLEKAQELCFHCGQAWRAAVLEGWRLFHDPNYSSNDGKVLAPLGNPQRDIWKRCTWIQSDDSSNDDTLSRAIYAALCGNLQTLHLVCSSWEDCLWAYTRVSIDVRVEKEIRSSSSKMFVKLPDRYWNSFMTLEDIFQRLKTTSEIKDEALTSMRLIQEYICLDKCTDLITQMSDWVDEIGDGMELNLARFLAHVVLVLRLLGRGYPDEEANNVIKAYVRMLVIEGNPEFVSYYASMLDTKDQVEEYAHFLVPITNNRMMCKCIEEAAAEDLKVSEITMRTVQLIWNRADCQMDQGDNLSKETTEADLNKINALNWLMFLPEQRADGLLQTNNVIRSFVIIGKLDAAREAYSKLPSGSFNLIISRYNKSGNNSENDMNNLPDEVSNAVKEYLCYKAYLDAHEGFSSWFKLFHSKPKENNQTKVGDFSMQVSQLENSKFAKEQLESWKSAIYRVTKTVRSQLLNVLLFPQNGWMHDVCESSDQRKLQLEKLCSLCIPEIVNLLHTLLHRMEMYKECLDLCTVIMSNKRSLYKVFTKQALKDFMDKIAESALCLSDKHPYDFGLPPAPEFKKSFCFE